MDTQSLLPDDQDSPARPGAAARFFTSSRGLFIALGLVVLLVVVAVVAIAAHGSPHSTRPAAAPPASRVGAVAPAPVAPSGPGLRLDDGVPVGQPDTSSGAVDAAVDDEEARTTPGYITDTAERHQVLAVIMAPDALASEERAEDAQAQQVMQALGVSAGQASFVARGAPLGVRVDSFSPQIATVEVWMAEVTGVASENVSTPPTASWSTYTLTLVWQHGWRAQSMTTQAGPTPLADSSSTPSTTQQWTQVQESFGAPPFAG